MKAKNSVLAEAFYRVRDLPFWVRTEPRNTALDLNFIKTHKKGACSSKHYLLAEIFQTMGYSSKFLTIPFWWQEQTFDYPENIKDILENLPMCYHLTLLLNDKDDEFMVDATWDQGLVLGNFPINEFHMEQRTVLAADAPVIHYSHNQRMRYITKKSSVTTEQLVKSIEFYQRLNAWCETLRQTRLMPPKNKSVAF